MYNSGWSAMTILLDVRFNCYESVFVDTWKKIFWLGSWWSANIFLVDVIGCVCTKIIYANAKGKTNELLS